MIWTFFMAQPGSRDRRIRCWYWNDPGGILPMSKSERCAWYPWPRTRTHSTLNSIDLRRTRTPWTRTRRTRTRYRVNYACYTGFGQPKVPTLTGVAEALAKISIWESVQEVQTRNHNLSWHNVINMANPSRSMGSLKGFCTTKAKALDDFLGSVTDRDITADDVIHWWPIEILR